MPLNRHAFAKLSTSFYVAIATTLASSLLLWWTNANWRADTLAYLEVLENMRLARTELMRGYLLTERLYGGEESLGGNGRCSYFEQAGWRVRDALTALEPMREEKVFRNGYPRVAEHLNAYRDKIDAMRLLACAAPADAPSPGNVLDLRKDMADAEKLHGGVSGDIHGKFKEMADLQDRFNSVLILCWTGLMALVSVLAGMSGIRRKRVEARLRLSEERFRLLVESAYDAIFMQSGGRFAYVNPSCVTLFGASSPADLLGQPVLERVHPDHRDAVAERIRKLNELQQTQPSREQAFVRLDGSFVDVEVAAVPVNVDNVNGALVYARDITERKKAEADVMRSLREKELLIKEVHHRVKNNLQIIVSLMYLQETNIDCQGELERFKLLEGRVRSMALIHEQLYQSGDLAAIDMAAYISKLLSRIATAFSAGRHVSVETDLEEVHLGIDKAVPCGLLVNELATNAFKHAFAERKSGVLRVALHRDDGTARLTVSDDGPGLPVGFDAEASQTLGMQLIGELARQLKGEVSRPEEQKACFEVTFPL
ncbi:sensor histidine kinase [Fundidesulfovibrio terrae]|uniref:sensor histidine kinase n=1 Tax=Fundidesulfovibrio terrae TaxID=2922866 RepID=UPI001FAFA1CC|nr:histidine kinase dimerization/phosphoacceptor domain -containing protein [Fundidesulfovibrio terrae]